MDARTAGADERQQAGLRAAAPARAASRRSPSSPTAGTTTPARPTTGSPTTPTNAQVLRDGGAVVLGITARDVEDAQSGPGSRRPGGAMTSSPSCSSSSVTFSTHDAEAVRAGPLTSCSAGSRTPTPAGTPRLADHLPLMFAPGASPPADRPRPPTSPGRRLCRLTDPHRAATGEANAWWWTNGPVGCLTRHAGQVHARSALVLDDRDEALARFRPRRRLAGVAADFQRAQPARPAHLDRRGHRRAQAGPPPAATDPGVRRRAGPAAGLAGTVRDLALDGPERSFLEELLPARACAAARAGHETDGGVPIDFAWPDRHIAVSASTKTTARTAQIRRLGRASRPTRRPSRPR